MPPTTTKTLSPAELAKLEHAFATDPASDAYRPLAEAYLGMGRFMEAMVVCKKGVKAHPTMPDPRVLLARVYAEQGKEKKALEELAGALQVAPNDKLALRLAGSLQLKTGEAEVGKANLLKAFSLDPADVDTQELMKTHKLEVPKPAAPEPVAPPPVAQPAPTNGTAAHATQAEAQSSGPGTPAQGVAPARAQPSAQARPASGARPAVKPQARRPAASRYQEESEVSEVSEISEISEISQVSGRPARRSSKKTGGSSKFVFLALVILAPAGLGAFWGIGKYKAKQKNEINGLLRNAVADMRHDSYDGYKSAIDKANKALEVDQSAAMKAHGVLAFAYAVRWGEHGGSNEDKTAAEEHVAEGLKLQDNAALLFAADALVPYYGGNVSKGLEIIKGHIAALGDRGKSSTLYLTQAIIQMNSGDLDGARESLETAQQLSSDDARVYVALGNLNRRRGMDRDALLNYDTAKRYEMNHADAILGTTAIVLDNENPATGYIAATTSLNKLLEGTPPPSPRQLAMAHALRGLLIARVSIDLPLYTDATFQANLEKGTGVGKDKDKNKTAVTREEELSMQLDKNNPELYLVKGKRLLWENNAEAAATEIRKAIALNDGRPHYYIELARALLRKEGGEKDAEEALRKALSKVPNNPRLLTLLGQVLVKQKRIDEAVTQFELSVKDARQAGSRNRNPEAFFALGRIYREKNDLVKAIEAFDFAGKQSVSDTAFASRAYDEEAQTAETKGDKAVARTNYERAVHVDEDNDGAICRFAHFLMKGGDPKDKDQIKDLAGKYLKTAPAGQCAAELKPLAG